MSDFGDYTGKILFECAECGFSKKFDVNSLKTPTWVHMRLQDVVFSSPDRRELMEEDLKNYMAVFKL
jgi:transcription elongation factor Elf1